MSEELKPCHCCGSKAKVYLDKFNNRETVSCSNKKCIYDLIQVSRSVWNRRHREDALHGIIDGQKVIIKELEAELAELRKANEWQPIETAPRDGSYVLGWCKAWANDVIQIRYLVGLNKWNTTMQPTHWRPLPLPPVKGE